MAIIISCSQNIKDKDCDIKELKTEKLSGEVMKLDSELMAPRKIYALDNGFVLYDKSNKEGFLEFFPDNADTIICYGKIGKGNGEFILPTCTQIGNNIYISSINSNYRKISFTNKNKIIDEIITIDNKKGFIGCNYFTKLSDNSFLISKTSENQINIINDTTNEALNFFPFKPKHKLSEFELANVIFVSSMAYSKWNNRMLFAYENYPYCVVADLKDKNIISNIRFKLHENTNRDTKNKGGYASFENPTLYYTFTIATRNNFWALYQDATSKELRKRKVNSEIHELSENGDIIKRIILDKTIYHFGINPNGNYIYTLSLNDKLVPEITKYILKKK